MNRIIRKKKKKRKKREKNSEKILDLRWQCNPNNETIHNFIPGFLIHGGIKVSRSKSGWRHRIRSCYNARVLQTVSYSLILIGDAMLCLSDLTKVYLI